MARPYVYAGQYDAGSIATADIGDSQVTSGKIAGDAIDGSKIADNAVDSEHIASGAIDGAHLSSDAKSSALSSKKLIQLVASVDLTDPEANNVTISSFPETTEFPFSTTAGVIADGSVTGIAVLLEVSAGNSGQAHGFNTNSNKVWGGQFGRYAAQVYTTDGEEVIDPATGNKVWAIITASARTTGGTYKIRFYSDEWSTASGELVLSNPYTMSTAYFLRYAVVTNVNDMAIDALRGDTASLSKAAAGILGSSIGTAELENDAVTADKIADGAIDDAAKLADSVVSTAKIADGAISTDKLADSAVTEAKILDSSVSSAKINNGAVTEGKIADGAVVSAKIGADAVDGSKIADNAVDSEHIAAGAIDTAHLADANVTEAKLHANVLLRDVEVSGPIGANGGVCNQSTSTAGAVTAQSSPDMSVQVAAGTVYNAAGKRISGASNSNLSIGAADATNPRYDLISFSASGVATVTAGTPGGSPSVPSLPAGHVKLAVVKIAANATTIANSVIYDHRAPAAPVWRQETFTGDGSTLDFALSRRARGAVLVLRGMAPQTIVASGQATDDEIVVSDAIEQDGTLLSYGTGHTPANGQFLTVMYWG